MVTGLEDFGEVLFEKTIHASHALVLGDVHELVNEQAAVVFVALADDNSVANGQAGVVVREKLNLLVCDLKQGVIWERHFGSYEDANACGLLDTGETGIDELVTGKFDTAFQDLGFEV
jgi:hypothetical protein